MYYDFKKKSEKAGVYTYEYGYQSRGKMTGEVSYNKNTDETIIIKLAKNDTGFCKVPPIKRVVLKHNAPEKDVIAYG
jgi:hypothetical protein